VDLQRRKVLSLERKSEWVMEYQITVTAYCRLCNMTNVTCGLYALETEYYKTSTPAPAVLGVTLPLLLHSKYQTSLSVTVLKTV